MDGNTDLVDDLDTPHTRAAAATVTTPEPPKTSGTSTERVAVKQLAVQAFRGEQVGDPQWIRVTYDEKGSDGKVLRVKSESLDISTADFDLANGNWDFFLRLKCNKALPKIHFEINVQGPMLGADGEVTCITLARADNVTLISTNGYYIQWRFPKGPIYLGSDENISCVSVRLFTSGEQLVDDLFLDTVEARPVV
ncbi:hypothetical protein AMAG_03998 [Allomyces macrogynus ATCC 38327]|uniref:Uncharacterized protein n=1 Tax=Allomyces macrogynus (strain ATCC 38327) TaxID=578462 RepID=A0A0L0S7T3_ALLM3|nr:hypothetical protein AMAG_03998 [Allomyces macrogynus ATCC 38327]|eukprot:KNE58424.1 hypothetical protein AMAG_03998 [Allomyces macrogynus ATCC 38327]